MTGFANLGRFLKEQRIKNNYTQAGLANALGKVHSQFVSNWERGRCAPPSDRLNDIIDLLKIDRDEIFRVMLTDATNEIKKKVYSKKAYKALGGPDL